MAVDWPAAATGRATIRATTATCGHIRARLNVARATAADIFSRTGGDGSDDFPHTTMVAGQRPVITTLFRNNDNTAAMASVRLVPGETRFLKGKPPDEEQTISKSPDYRICQTLAEIDSSYKNLKKKITIFFVRPSIFLF